jgi:hypothetical protein
MIPDELDKEISAFVGVKVDNRIIYNIVERDGEFENTGMSIIRFLNNDKNLFVSKIIESQSYMNIKLILDDEVLFNELDDKTNANIEKVHDVFNLIDNNPQIKYFYIYDIVEDILIIEIPFLHKVIALDYKNSSHVRDFINNLK